MSGTASFLNSGTTISAGVTNLPFTDIKFSHSSAPKYEIERATDTVEDKEYTFGVYAKSRKLEVNLYYNEADFEKRHTLLNDFQNALIGLGSTSLLLGSSTSVFGGFIDGIDIVEEDNCPLVVIKLTYAI